MCDNSAFLSASVDLIANPESTYNINCDGIETNVQSPITTSTTMLSATSPNGTNQMYISSAAQITQQQQQLLDDIATENYWLREKMKEITTDRDRLLCEVANLRLELDMVELKRLPEDR